MAKASKAVALPSVTEIARRVQETKTLPEEVLDLIKRADTGNAAALARLRELYTALPSIVSHLSDLQYSAEQDVLGTFPAGARETTTKQADLMRKRLAGDSPSPLERLLVNRVVLDWLHAMKSEMVMQQRTNGSLSLASATYYDKHAERAQRRFLRAAVTLAQVRKLLTPAVQINVAEQQVNIAGTVQAGAGETGNSNKFET